MEIAKNHSKEEFRSITEEKKNWPVLYHFSPFRENIVEWIPLSKEDKVLEVGSGCGAITGALAKKAGSVTCIDLSDKRSQINAYRLQNTDNVRIMVGNFKDVETALERDFDAIMLIGVFEYGIAYIDTDNPYEDFLRILLKHLKPGGRIYIAIENKMGLKYFAGCTEDHAGRYFEGLEGYPGGGVARTFTRKGLEKIFHACGVEEYSFYYPYPDYKFPHTIFSDEILPKKGELHDNIRNFDRARMILMDETKVFDTVIEEEEFPLFSNSYLAIIGPEVKQKLIKYSNDRDDKFGICTTIEKENDGYIVKKRAVSDASLAHIAAIENAYHDLCIRFDGCQVSFNKCQRIAPDTLSFEFLPGITLEELLDDALRKNDKDAFMAFFKRYEDIVSYNESEPVTDYDLIFQNILVNGDEWSVIDYEWTVSETIPAREMIQRALWCYIQGNQNREVIKPWCLPENDFGNVVNREKEFQRKVQGNHPALSVIRHVIGKAAFSLDYMLTESGDFQHAIQIYEDFGNGFSEENSYFVTDYLQTGKEVSVQIPLKSGLKRLRIDPGNKPAIVIVRALQTGTTDLSYLLSKKDFLKRDTNGKRLLSNGYLFTNNDPHFAFSIPQNLISDSEEVKINLQMRIEQLSADAASYLN